jgi:carbon monoxide dehydrogenase subunit G
VPSAEYSTTAKLPVDTIWDFVKEMDNWAGYVTGYQSHEKQSETDSVWVLKGDVGVLARVLKFQVHISEWNGPSCVRFELKGLNEPMEGSGSFEMQRYEEAEAAPAAAPRARNLLLRLLEAVVRFFLRLVGGGRPQRAAGADAGPGAGMAKLTFRLEINPGGPMAPMVSAMMKPAMLPAAEQLANAIMARLEETHGAKA